jgi:tetratricopeptide (TPR) repeat protein
MNRSFSTVSRVGLTLAVMVPLLASACGRKDWQGELDIALSASSQGPEQLIKGLEEFLEKDPPLRLASEARFTIGFTFAEELRQYAEARRWFTELLEEDSNGAWAEEAQWMLENMEKDVEELLPGLIEEVPPPR